MAVREFYPRALPRRLPEVFNILRDSGIEDAVVFGGCLRDAHFNRPIRDFDLLIPTNRYLSDTPNHLFKKVSRGATHVSELRPNKYAISFQDGLLIDVYFTSVYDSAWKTAQIKAEEGNLGLSSIAMSQKSGRVFVDGSFLEDARQQTLTYKPEILDCDPIPAYVKKINAKYPDFSPRYLNVIDTGW